MTLPRVKLADLLMPVSRPEPVEPHQEYCLLGARWYAGGLFVKDKKSGSEIRARVLYRVKEGDFVYNRLFAWKGSFATATSDDDGCYVSNEFPCFRPIQDRIDRDYLRLYFARESSWNEALGRSSGSTPTSRNRLKEEQLLSMTVPLPPLAEQQRIVARVEELAAKIEEARGLRRAATPDSLVRAFTAAAFAYPCWPRLQLGEVVTETQNGLSPRPRDVPPGTRILRISAATSRPDGIVDETDYKFLDVTDSQASKFSVHRGDLLACRFNGNLSFVGRFAIFQGTSGERYVYPDKLIRFRVNPEVALSEYVGSAMNSPAMRAAIEERCATTAGNIGISGTALKMIELPVPPIPEQRAIVESVRNFQATIEIMRRLQDQTSVELEALMPAILDRAFRGEL